MTVLSSLEISEAHQAVMMRGLKQMVEETAAVRRYLGQSEVDYTLVGGKTGTAQIDRYVTDEATGETVKYELTNALFTGVYAPNDTPELVVSVVIEKASHGYDSSLTAARIFGAWEELRG